MTSLRMRSPGSVSHTSDERLICNVVGAACAQPASDRDACGCASGTGWSKHADPPSCVEGGTTTATEAVTCSAMAAACMPSTPAEAVALVPTLEGNAFLTDVLADLWRMRHPDDNILDGWSMSPMPSGSESGDAR